MNYQNQTICDKTFNCQNYDMNQQDSILIIHNNLDPPYCQI